MNRKRVERIIKVIMDVICVETILVYRLHNYPLGENPPLSWKDIFFDSAFWIFLIVLILCSYCSVCYDEYKQEEQEYKRKKHEENEDDGEDENEDDT